MKKTIFILAVIASVFTIAITSCGQNQQIKTDMKTEEHIFPKGELITNDYFTGDAYLQMLMTNEQTFDCSIGNVTFDPGCRNNWHSHPGGQLLLVTSGEGYYQEQGKPVRLIKTGDVVEIAPDVIHWHGATPDSPMVHLAISTRSSMGPGVWGDPVSDEDYYSYTR